MRKEYNKILAGVLVLILTVGTTVYLGEEREAAGAVCYAEEFPFREEAAGETEQAEGTDSLIEETMPGSTELTNEEFQSDATEAGDMGEKNDETSAAEEESESETELSVIWAVEIEDEGDGAKGELCPVSGNRIHTGDVVLHVCVEEYIEHIAETSSCGLESIAYRIEKNQGKVTQEGILYMADENGEKESDETNEEMETIGDSETETINDTKAEEEAGDGETVHPETPVRNWTGTITVDAEKNNSCDVVVYVVCTDNAGNTYVESKPLDIDCSRPVITLQFDEKEPYRREQKEGRERGYFSDTRTAWITIEERSAHLNSKSLTECISVTATDSQGKDVSVDEILRSMQPERWKTVTSEWDENRDMYTVQVCFDIDANYTVELGCRDLGGLDHLPVRADGCVTPYEFTVDRGSPIGELIPDTGKRWGILADRLSFGRFYNHPVSVQAAYMDEISPIASVQYYKSTEKTALNRERLEHVDEREWRELHHNGQIVAEEEEAFSIYLRVIDYAGNVAYISTDGMIIDRSSPIEEMTVPRISITVPQRAEKLIYAEDVPVQIQVTDPLVGGSCSGLKEVRYEVFNQGSVTQRGVLYVFETPEPVWEELVQNWNGMITVDSFSNNSNDVKIVVSALDNAGNASEECVMIQIDIDSPKITVSYDNNAGEVYAGRTYFNKERTAVIRIQERNFDPETVKVQISSTGKVIPTVSEWRRIGSSGNPDDTVHMAEITYNADGDYTFEISCRDGAGNRNMEVEYVDSQAPGQFTIDRSAPDIRVHFDNNAVSNRFFYNDSRTAVLAITERNFDSSCADVSMTAVYNGRSISLPVVSEWSRSGDIHTAMIRFEEDGFYTLEVRCQDLAGNDGGILNRQWFYIDRTSPEIRISGIRDESANAGDGKIGFSLYVSDVNLESVQPELTAFLYQNGQFIKKSVELDEVRETEDGRMLMLSVDNLEQDGIYYLSCAAVDLAGNECGEIILYDALENCYVKQIEDDEYLIRFSINRNGSAFRLNDSTEKLLKERYVQHVTEDIVVQEVNIDALEQYSVSVNGTVLKEHQDYEVHLTEKEGIGYWYEYHIFHQLFQKEGSYRIEISSVDMAGNRAFSDMKNAALQFTVDRTPPIVAVSGLEEGGTYRTNLQKVYLVMADDGGELQSVRVETLNEDGTTAEVLLVASGETLRDTLEKDGMLSFELREGLNQTVRIICSDSSVGKAGTGNINTKVFTNVSVSASDLRIFWNNQKIRWGMFIGIAVLGCVIGLLSAVCSRKRRSS